MIPIRNLWLLEMTIRKIVTGPPTSCDGNVGVAFTVIAVHLLRDGKATK